jgi:hypothetical protein
MDIMAHSPFPRPARRGPVFLGGRTPGGAVGPEPTDDPDWDELGEPTDFTVGVVDTGILLTWPERMPHPWLVRHLSICPEDDEDLIGPADADGVATLSVADGHGTFVSGLVLREAPRARVRMYGVVDDQLSPDDGLGRAEDRMVAAAIRVLAVDPRVQVINLSFGGGVFADGDEPPALLEAALADVDLTRVAVVAAAGNEPSGVRTWPAAFPGVIAVGAVDTSVRGDGPPLVASFSNRGDWVDAYAPGVAVTGPFFEGAALVPRDEPPTRPSDDAYGEGFPPPFLGPELRRFGGWASWSGTSFAAATVSGRIAALAMEHGITGAAAANRLLADSPTLAGQAGVLVR